jgi:hypothetical protein
VHPIEESHVPTQTEAEPSLYPHRDLGLNRFGWNRPRAIDLTVRHIRRASNSHTPFNHDYTLSAEREAFGGSSRYAPRKKQIAPTNVAEFTIVRLMTSPVVGSMNAANAESMKNIEPT